MTSTEPQEAASTIDFGPIVIEYDDRVLAPRPWTLAQSAWAAELSARVPPGPLLELHCGAGHIGLAAALLSGRTLVQIDDAPDACRWARHNAARLGIASDVRCASVDAALGADERFPLVVADPPYLRTDHVVLYVEDPIHAVDGGPDGLAEISRCLTVLARCLASDGAALLQVRGAGQAAEVEALLAASVLGLQVEETRAVTAERAILLMRPM